MTPLPGAGSDRPALAPHPRPRHTAVSLAIQAGAHPKEIQAMAGHSNLQTTMDVYGDVMPGMGDALASRIDLLRETALGPQLVPEVLQVLPLRAEKGA